MVNLHDYFTERENAILAESRAARVFSSMTGRGRAREHFVSRFLAEQLPTRLTAERGEVIDSEGHNSGETDCVLVDHESPAYRLGGESLVPIEAAVAVLEVKSDLSGDQLADAVRKIALVKTLERTPHHGFYRTGDETPRVPVPPRTAHGYIVAYKAPSWEHLHDRLASNPAWYSNDWLAFGPEIICILGRGFMYKNDRHFWYPSEHLRNMAAVRLEDRPGTQYLLEHVQETLGRYGGLTYELGRYNLGRARRGSETLLSLTP